MYAGVLDTDEEQFCSVGWREWEKDERMNQWEPTNGLTTQLITCMLFAIKTTYWNLVGGKEGHCFNPLESGGGMLTVHINLVLNWSFCTRQHYSALAPTVSDPVDGGTTHSAWLIGLVCPWVCDRLCVRFDCLSLLHKICWFYFHFLQVSSLAFF